VLQISNCLTFDDAVDLITNDNFKRITQEKFNLIEVIVEIREEFKLLENFQLDAIEEKFKEKTFFIFFQSKVDGKFFIRWNLQGRMRMAMLEIVDDFSEDLSVISDFLRNFLRDCLIKGETGLCFFILKII
jgi:hypothetical protein